MKVDRASTFDRNQRRDADRLTVSVGRSRVWRIRGEGPAAIARIPGDATSFSA
jgi:hypothetical protein